MILNSQIDEFLKNFTPTLKINSPGRINLIGEHTDYNLGYVLPSAIDKSIIFQFSRNSNASKCNIFSEDFDQLFTFDLSDVQKGELMWANYLLGVVYGIHQHTDKLEGFDCILKSNLPIGSGLSSSAALECGLAFGLNELFNLELSKLEIIQISQKAEHDFVGTKCGIMDQYASVMSEKGNALLLDCRSVQHENVPINLEPYQLVLLNTNVSHNLASSEYNTRRNECAEGVDILKKKLPNISSLRDVTLDDLNVFHDFLPKKILKRCQFVVEENDRVLKTKEALKNNNLNKFGRLLNESHQGLSKKYEVSCEELDFLHDYGNSKPYILGSRMMGGGFGGCTINLIHKDHMKDYIPEVSKAYKEKFNLDLGVIPVNLSSGTTII
ncbi:galactokinase [Namhaeicola litoreus]|uniref:Galactokinase n=1 Tax=Namhaeicola litoreus TaxID=1052145 RepID=A0ABW3Y3X7_9FLAO